MACILIVEDDPSISMGLEDNLRLEGYEVVTAADGNKGLKCARDADPDLIVLDIKLPAGPDGLEICRRLRREGRTVPILMLTAKAQEADKIVGLELGADDYLTKPFSSRELLARIKALLRRANPCSDEGQVVCFGDVKVDFGSYEATKDGEPLPLTALEFALLKLFVQRAGEVLSRDTILDQVWGEEVVISPRAVDTHVAHLRQKIEPDPGRPRFLVGVRGVGYKFVC